MRFENVSSSSYHRTFSSSVFVCVFESSWRRNGKEIKQRRRILLGRLRNLLIGDGFGRLLPVTIPRIPKMIRTLREDVDLFAEIYHDDVPPYQTCRPLGARRS